MKALTLNPIMAHLVVHGGKLIENRSWKVEPQQVVIHAAARLDIRLYQRARADLGADLIPAADDLARGAVIGAVDILSVHSATCPADRHTVACQVWGEHHDGRWHWVLGNVRSLSEPIPAQGQQRLWTPGTDVASAIEIGLKEAMAR